MQGVVVSANVSAKPVQNAVAGYSGTN